MSIQDNGGPAFPHTKPNGMVTYCGTEEPPLIHYNVEGGMSLREWFATHCPADWFKQYNLKTIGDTRDALIKRGIIPQERANISAIDAYNDAEFRQLWIAIRWEYADSMLAERAKGQSQ